ncbi:MAG TPA: hypothetical protein VI199_03655 [Novosphingobium sp.]
MEEVKRGPGRPRKVMPDAMTVLKEDAISSGEWGGFLKVGETFVPVDDGARAAHIAKGHAK